MWLKSYLSTGKISIMSILSVPERRISCVHFELGESMNASFFMGTDWIILPCLSASIGEAKLN